MPLIKKISAKTGASKKAISSIIMLLLYMIMGTAAVLLSSFVLSEISAFFSDLPNIYKNGVEPLLSKAEAIISNYAQRQELLSALKSVNFSALIENALSVISSFIINSAGKAAAILPKFAIAFIFTLVLSFFICRDFESINRAILSYIPVSFKKGAAKLQAFAKSTAFKYIKSCLILMFITFTEFCIGLTIIGSENPIAIALLISAADFLPFIGTGIIVLPWILLSLLWGKYSFAISLIILYLIITVIRCFIEPKIIGKQIGLNPIITLICLYAGNRLFGIGGIFIAPVAAVLFQYISDAKKQKHRLNKI